VTWKETAEAFADPRHNHHPLKMSKTRNILRLKKRSRALPSSPWLGHEQEGGGADARARAREEGAWRYEVERPVGFFETKKRST
jgi:hypothetical protein